MVDSGIDKPEIQRKSGAENSTIVFSYMSIICIITPLLKHECSGTIMPMSRIDIYFRWLLEVYYGKTHRLSCDRKF